MAELRERVARVEAELEMLQEEVGNVRKSLHDFRENHGILVAQVSSLAATMTTMQSQIEMIAERAAQKAIAAAGRAKSSTEAALEPLIMKFAIGVVTLAAAALTTLAGLKLS